MTLQCQSSCQRNACSVSGSGSKRSDGHLESLSRCPSVSSSVHRCVEGWLGCSSTKPNCSKDMENSPKLESMPTLCRSAILPAKTTISKWRVTATIRQRLQLPTEGTSAFGDLRAIASLQPPSNFRDVSVFRSHQLPLYGNECLE